MLPWKLTMCRPMPCSTCNNLGRAENAANLGYGIQIYDGKEYSEKEYFVCAVRLLNFVPGKMLTETPLSTELLFNAAMAVGRMDRDLKVGLKMAWAD